MTLPMEADGKYKVGDIFNVSPQTSKFSKAWNFDGLEIKSIHFNFGVVLTFDHYQWTEKLKRKGETS